MKVLLPLMMMGCAVVGYIVGYSVGPQTSVLAQAQAQKGVASLERPGRAPLAPDQPAKEQYWNVDDLRKMHTERAAAAAAGKPMPYLPFVLARTHTIGLMTRLPSDKPISSNLTGRMSQWDDAEQHQGVSDIYVIAGGSGTMIVGGEIDKREYRPSNGPGSVFLPGEFAGQPIIGGRTYKVKSGRHPQHSSRHPAPG